MDAAAKAALASAEDSMIADAPAFPHPARATRQPAEAVPEVAPQDPWSKVRALALRQLDRFISLEARVLRGDDPEAIHDLRVASRRLQQILDLLYPAPRLGEFRKLRRRIRRARRALGDVRNADVQLARVNKILARKRTARREAWQALHDYLADQRSEGFASALDRLSRLNLAALYIRAKALLAEHDQTSAVAGGDSAEAPRSYAQRFEERAAESLDGVWQAFQARVAESHRDSQPSVIHGVRIAAKRLRYLVEVLHDFGVEGSAETLAWLRGLQELLGGWHDLEVLEQMMLDLVARPAYLRDNLGVAMDVERLILKNRANKGKLREMYFRQTLEGAEYGGVRIWMEKTSALKELRIEDLKLQTRNSKNGN